MYKFPIVYIIVTSLDGFFNSNYNFMLDVYQYTFWQTSSTIPKEHKEPINNSSVVLFWISDH